MSSASFSERLLNWFDQSGRKDLPWQQNINPYRVWVSEIMLQQTQVTTATPYYLSFMHRFPTLPDLADADVDEVLSLWTGLGYYARARNLHKAARQVQADFGGEFPRGLEDIQSLPGIGPSTAGAIYSIACGGRAPILDGNVKRVLSRHGAIAGWPGQKEVENRLWVLAEQCTPQQRVADYTQAIMDLGASLCSRSRPQCDDCPVNDDCQSKLSGEQHLYPGKKPRKAMPVKKTVMLLVENAEGEILLQQRPAAGIWGGLWSLPELENDSALEDFIATHLNCKAEHQHWGEMRHTFSHFHLDITPVHLKLLSPPKTIMEATGQLWYNGQSEHKIGLAAPVKKLLDTALQGDLLRTTKL